MKKESGRFFKFQMGLLSLALLAGCAGPLFQTQRPVPVEQQKAFDAGMKAFYDREFKRSAAVFQSLAEHHPGSPLMDEMVWMWARSIEERSEFGEAIHRYKLFIEKFPLSRRRSEAEFRVQHLGRFMAQRPAPDSFPRRVGRVLENPPAKPENLSRFLTRGKIQGEHVLVIPAFAGEGASFDSRGNSALDPVLPAWVREARSRGWKVWAALELRKFPGRPRPGSGKGSALNRRDLFDPSTHGKLVAVLKEVAHTGVDGIVIDDDPLYDPGEGFSKHATRAFQKDFGRSHKSSGKAGVGTPFNLEGKISDDPLLWQMSGWRNRESMERIGKLIAEVREEFPSLVWAQRVSRESVTEPHIALVRSGENLVQSLQSGVDFFIVPFSFRDPDPYVFLRKAAEVMGEPRRMILSLPMDEREWVERFEKNLPPVGFFFGREAGEAPRP